MPHTTRTLIPLVVTCLLLCASGGRIATAQTVADDTANPSPIEPEMILQKLHQQQQWIAEQQQRIDLQDDRDAQQNERINELEEENRLLSESDDNELQQVPTTDVSYTLEAGHHNQDYSTSLSDLESQVGALWNAIPIWQPYLVGSFRGGGTTERGELNLFLPLIWSDSALLFADLRGSIGDTGNHEGNWSVAARKLTSSDWILGAWGGYDLRESSTGNHFDQVSFGIEAMNLDWDFRMNGYVPTNMGPQTVPGIPTAVFTGNNIVVRSNQERAFGGLDGEIGRLLWSNVPCCCDNDGSWMSSLDAELRAFVGGYYFNNSAQGFEEISGPRARSELRLYDLAMLGEGSRLTLEGFIQHDNVRGTQAEAGLYIRIPFGSGSGRSLGRIERRMVDRIVRDVDVVASNQTIDDPANFASTGLAIDSVRVVDATDDLSVEVAAAGPGSVVIVDGSAGIISEGDTTVLSSGQVVMGGGGSTLDVVGRNTGAQAQFTTPGTRPQINGTDAGTDVFQIVNDSALTGLDITGGNDGVFGDSVTGFTLRDLNISGAGGDGVFLNGTNSGDILNVVSNFNSLNGISVFVFTGGTISDNTASGNDLSGFIVDTFNGGTFSENTASENGHDGFDLVSTVTGGTISDNTASDNGLSGFRMFTFTGGTFSGNTASENDNNGFIVDSFTGGTFSGNTANGHETGRGFQLAEFLDGTIRGNTASGNAIGFGVTFRVTGGTISANMASGNFGDGFFVHTLTGGKMSGNTASENGDDGFSVGTVGTSAVFSNNTSTNNIGLGYSIIGTPLRGVTTNTGSGNSGGENSF